MNAGADSRFRKIGLECLAVLNSYDVEMIDTLCPRRLNGRYNRSLGLRQQVMVTMRKRAPRFIPVG